MKLSATASTAGIMGAEWDGPTECYEGWSATEAVDWALFFNTDTWIDWVRVSEINAELSDLPFSAIDEICNDFIPMDWFREDYWGTDWLRITADRKAEGGKVSWWVISLLAMCDS